MKKINYLSLSTLLVAGIFSTACTQQQTQMDSGLAGSGAQLAADQQVQDTQIPVKVIPVAVAKPAPVYRPMVKPKQVMKVRPMVKPKQILKVRPM